MARGDVQLSARTRNTVSKVLDSINSLGQRHVAEAIGVDESTVTRMKEQLPKFIGALEAAGFKCVPTEVKCFDPKDIAAMFHFAKKHLERMQTVDALEFDEDAE